MISLDFETYYDKDYSVADLGYWAYTHHPKFNAYLVAACDGAESVSCAPAAFDWERVHGQEVIAHNAAFDRAVFERLQELGTIPAHIRPARWVCTAALSAYLQCPRSLQGAVHAILGFSISKDVRARARGKQGELLGMSAEDQEYNMDDARYAWLLWDKAGKYWPEREQLLAALTERIGAQGIAFDAGYATQQRDRLATVRDEAAAKLPWAAAGGAVASPKALEEACAAAGIAAPVSTADDAPELEAWLAEHAGKPAAAWVGAMQEWRRANRALRVLETMLARVKADGRVEAHLKYFGASTGRWSGGHGLNFQNLNSDTTLVDMRGCLVAPAGKRLAVIDLAQIEARVLLWMVGDSKTLALVRQGMSVYEAHARATMGWTGGPLKQENPKLYKLAKARVLGLGYGCGKDKFVRVAKVMAGLDVSPEEAAQVVDDYRRANPGIPQFWRTLQGALEAHDGGTFYLELPSGRDILYRRCNAEAGTAEQIKDERPGKVYGGLLCENAVQAVARDLFADRLLALVGAGFKPVLLVHDEYVLEVDAATAEQDLQTAIHIITTPPHWAAGLPVECEGQLMERYAK